MSSRDASGGSSLSESGGSWTLLTGHGHVLVEIARNPHARMRDISTIVGLTERTVQAIVADLEAAGYLTRGRTGRRNRYTINPDSLFRHSAQEGLRVGPFLDLLAAADADGHDTGPADADERDQAQPPRDRKPPPGAEPARGLSRKHDRPGRAPH